jgi:hypothetical protein
MSDPHFDRKLARAIRENRVFGFLALACFVAGCGLLIWALVR